MQMVYEQMAPDVGHICKLNMEFILERARAKFTEQKKTNKEFVVLLLDVDAHRPMAEYIMPNNEATWQKERNEGRRPFMRGTVSFEVGKQIAEYLGPGALDTLNQELPTPSCFIVMILGPDNVYITYFDSKAPSPWLISVKKGD
jgi:hypothetical protein